MIHMVFMKLEPGVLTDEVFQEYKDTFELIKNDMAEVLDACVRRNCVERDQNMDLLIELRLSGKEALKSYLGHPAHIAIGEKMNPHVVRIASFDYEEN